MRQNGSISNHMSEMEHQKEVEEVRGRLAWPVFLLSVGWPLAVLSVSVSSGSRDQTQHVHVIHRARVAAFA